MHEARRFAFETVFAKDGAVLSESRDAPIYTIEDVERARAEGVAEGRRLESAKSEAAALDALRELEASASALLATLASDRRKLAEDAVALGLAAAKKIAGVALDSYGEERATKVLQDAMEICAEAPRLIVRISPSCAEALEPRLLELAANSAFDGALKVRRESTMRRGDVVVEWPEGVLSVTADDIENRINTLLSAPAGVTEETNP